jgi:Kef-type K+ transport system membrane component KefB
MGRLRVRHTEDDAKMIEYDLNYPLLVLLTGIALLSTMLIKLVFERLRVSPVVGYLLLGFGLRSADESLGYLEQGVGAVFHFLATIGVITLLFRVGLLSDLGKLIGQLRRASLIWIANVVVSGLVGYGAARHLLGFDVLTGLIVGVALTATSVGISIGIWQEEEATKTEAGSLLLDVAELDDISAIVIMGLLFSLLPVLGQPVSPAGTVLATSALFGVKLTGFVILCYILARFMEHPFIAFFRRHETPPIAMLAIIGTGFLIASLAGLMGFSVAIGAFFAGLVFSRDPEAVEMEASFLPLYSFFTPFFFIGVGLDIDPTAFSGIAVPALVLITVAFFGKLLANCLPLLFVTGPVIALAIGFSMVPRAEIAMLVMQRGLNEKYVSGEVYTAMVLVSAVTCIVAPLVVQPLLKKWPPQ